MSFVPFILTDREPTVIDNACGTIARLIMAMGDALPVGELLPAMVNALPLRDDFEENVTVYNCLFGLYAQASAFFFFFFFFL